MAVDALYVAARRALLDALDVYRLLRSVEPRVFSAGFALLVGGELAASSTQWAVSEFARRFGESRAFGVEMVARATGGLVPEAEVRAACLLLRETFLLPCALPGPSWVGDARLYDASVDAAGGTDPDPNSRRGEQGRHHLLEGCLPPCRRPEKSCLHP